MHIFIFIFLILSSLSSFAQISVPDQTIMCPPQQCPTCPSCARGHTETYRDDSFGQLMVGYQFANTWVVGKKTASWTQILSRDWSIELEYAGSKRDVKVSGFELGDISEQRVTLFGKYYVGNSFYVDLGPYYYMITVDTNDKIVDASNNRIASRWNIDGLGVAAGFGSRWQNKWGLTWGFDWFRVNAPMKTVRATRTTNLGTDDEAQVKRTFTLFKTVPTFVFGGVNIGYTF